MIERINKPAGFRCVCDFVGRAWCVLRSVAATGTPLRVHVSSCARACRYLQILRAVSLGCAPRNDYKLVCT